MGSVKRINIKDQSHCIFNDMINIKNIDLNSRKIDTKTFIFITLDILP